VIINHVHMGIYKITQRSYRPRRTLRRIVSGARASSASEHRFSGKATALNRSAETTAARPQRASAPLERGRSLGSQSGSDGRT
jgi:hypothetical protein